MSAASVIIVADRPMTNETLTGNLFSISKLTASRWGGILSQGQALSCRALSLTHKAKSRIVRLRKRKFLSLTITSFY